jgi:peptide/nickel transport system permease protein
MRPTLPTIITSLMLVLIGTWTGQIILETVFNWPGLGRQYLAAVNFNDTPVILGTLVISGYLLAGTLLLLEFIYAAVDPRVRTAGGRR